MATPGSRGGTGEAGFGGSALASSGSMIAGSPKGGYSDFGSPRSMGASMGGTGSPQAKNVKSKITELDRLVHELDLAIKRTNTRIAQVEEEKHFLGILVARNHQEITAALNKEVKAITQDVEHRFSLQAAENRHLRAQLAECRKEIEKLHRYMDTIAQRVSDAEHLLGE
jgi:uncharacterized coiled-coil protein SlyX